MEILHGIITVILGIVFIASAAYGLTIPTLTPQRIRESLKERK